MPTRRDSDVLYIAVIPRIRRIPWTPRSGRPSPRRSTGRRSHLAPRASLLVPLQRLEVAALRRPRARLLVPRASARPLLLASPPTRTSARPRARPLQRLELAAPRRVRARPHVPRASVLARPLQRLEVAARRCKQARRQIPRKILRSQRLQLLELSAPRRCAAHETFVLQKTSRVPVLQQAHVSEVHRVHIRQLLYLTPRRVHGVAHPATHRAKPTEVPGLGQKVRSENVRGDHLEGKAREAAWRVGGIHGSIVVLLRRIRGHRRR